jgi:hypothetical protein
MSVASIQPQKNVMPAYAGIQASPPRLLDASFRWHDNIGYITISVTRHWPCMDEMDL